MDRNNSYSAKSPRILNKPTLSNLPRHEMKLQHTNSLIRDSLHRQKSISVPITESNFTYGNKSSASPVNLTRGPTNSSAQWTRRNEGPKSFDSSIQLKRHQINQNISPNNMFLQVHTPNTRMSLLPHQHSGESTESAVSCVSEASHSECLSAPPTTLTCSSSSPHNYTSFSDITCYSPTKERIGGIWPTFKKLIKDKNPMFKKRKTEVHCSESYMDPVYHLLKCGANPDHQPDTCLCDCHVKNSESCTNSPHH